MEQDQENWMWSNLTIEMLNSLFSEVSSMSLSGILDDGVIGNKFSCDGHGSNS